MVGSWSICIFLVFIVGVRVWFKVKLLDWLTVGVLIGRCVREWV